MTRGFLRFTPLLLFILAVTGMMLSCRDHSDASARPPGAGVNPDEQRPASATPAVGAERSTARPDDKTAASPPVMSNSVPPEDPQRLPRLIDLGAGKCFPCKMMAPILEELKREYAGQFDVVFIDVWKDPEPGRAYGIKVIPTQIFLDASGIERFRHEGFFGKEDILAEWAELGVTLEPPKS